jgi:hypothetical protein
MRKRASPHAALIAERALKAAYCRNRRSGAARGGA